MIESIIVGVIVAGAAIASGRYLLREVATGKRPCSGCGDDCPLAESCSSRARAQADCPCAAPGTVKEATWPR